LGAKYLLDITLHAFTIFKLPYVDASCVFREAPRMLVGSDVAIHEVGDDLSDSDESNATDANDYMHAAGLQVARANNERDNMVNALNNMVLPTHASVRVCLAFLCLSLLCLVDSY
jgi:hypothetical protein